MQRQVEQFKLEEQAAAGPAAAPALPQPQAPQPEEAQPPQPAQTGVVLKKRVSRDAA